MKRLMMQFYPTSVTSSLFSPNMLLSTLFSNTLSLCSVRSCESHAQPSSWKTTPCRLFAIAYSVFSQLPSMSGDRQLHPQPEDAPCRGDKRTTEHGIHVSCCRNSQTCLRGIRFLEDATPVGNRTYRLRVWEHIARNELGMQRCRLIMQYKPRSFVPDNTYVRLLLNSMRFTELRITGRFWPDMPLLVTNLSTLISLDLSRNGIRTFPDGE
jgi:hypothetical protein